MKKILHLILLFMVPILTNGQKHEADQKAILGKWNMIKMEIKDGFYFDVSDKDSSFTRFAKVIAEGYDNFSNGKEDSSWIKPEFEKAFDEFKQLFVEYQNDNKYSTNQSGGGGVLTLITGTFSLDDQKHVLHIFDEQKKNTEFHYEIIDKLLILRPMETENSTSKIIFKKSE